MKTLPLVFLLNLTVFVSHLIAQPILTGIGCIPTIGYNFNRAGNGGFAVGGSGPNQTWDLATISDTAAEYGQYISVSSSIYGTQFPNANIAGSYNNGTHFTIITLTMQLP